MIGRGTAAAALLALVAAEPALAHNGAAPVSRIGSAWDAPPLLLVPAAVALLLFAQAFVRLRRRGRADHASWSRPPLFLLAVVLGTLPLLSPLDAVGDSYLLSGHMLQHVVIGDAAPALALVALRGPLLFFFLPSFALRPLARLRWLRRLLAFLLRPLVSLATWMVVIAAWHVPAAYDYTLRNQAVHDLEHLSFKYFDTHQTGLLLSTMTDDVSTVQDFVSSDTLSILVDLMTIVGMLGLMFWLNWDFTLLVVAITPFLLLFVARFRTAVKKATREVRRRESDIVAVLQAGLESVRTVPSFGMRRAEPSAAHQGRPLAAAGDD